ncbi:hypothetical protein SAMN05216359_10715 [Roseateles sp. YR242]|uniref:hypothetical protein n=1 Tax=Roseateles sp. YR242 TaxID=1855305 RepID=UPI0008B5CDA2|nr:hypothetical protein [Roseateles sp. YR242]SEL26766.1 hypothetical protein SAMN05216359_10715 [Roseateles sp. YR242]
MTYEQIKPPFTLKFKEMSKKELKDYFAWFQSVIPQRYEELTREVQQLPQFADWQSDGSPASLDALGEWFALQVEVQPRTAEEVAEIESRSEFAIGISGEELTSRTFSLAMDVGMYLSQVFLKNNPLLRWDQPFGNRKFVDYGQPVLAGFGPVPFNPVRMTVTLVYGLASKKEGGRGLAELYLIWTKLIRP